MIKEPVNVVEPEIETACRNGLTYDAVLEKLDETAFKTYDAVWEVTTYDAVLAFCAVVAKLALTACST